MESSERDQRIQWLEARVVSSLKKTHSDLFKRMLSKEDSLTSIQDFLSTPEIRHLFIYFASSDSLIASLTPPSLLSKKLLYFLKKTPVEITMKNIANEVLNGDINTGPLRHMLSLCSEIYIPLMRKQDLPEDVLKESLDALQRFIDSAYVTLGSTQGKTLLPLLPGSSNNFSINEIAREKVFALESAVVLWSKQIKSVLAPSPNSWVNPLNELDFWSTKAGNLNSIHMQLDSEPAKQVLQVLENAQSNFAVPFQQLVNEIAIARKEAIENNRVLQPLSKYLQSLTQTGNSDFTSLPELFTPIIHFIRLIWVKFKN
eukprot:TRINITY_DN8119_c0_g1_i1.p1 TRINITY_DN8119_c0_g1~~TRINITY_DN8119_c0_g1_i1.p1  ORF type:complete len:335 (-),score=82.01 TRINITY_DN8119_c0_g1_i1:33-977(-)